MVLLCLWALGSGGVPTLPVGSPLSGPVGVLPQSTTVAWLSLLWLGWPVLLPQADAVGFGLCWSALLTSLLMGRCYSFPLMDSSSLVGVLPQSTTVAWLSLLWLGWPVLLPQADAVGFGLCWSALLTSLLMGRCYSFPPDSSSLAWLKGGAFHRVPSPLSSFGMWSPFGVISVFCHYWSPMKVSIGGVFLLCGSLSFNSAVVVSLCPFVMAPSGWWQRFSLAYHCSY